MTEEKQRLAELEHRLQKDWGPDLPLWKRRMLAAFVVLVFFGLIVAALLTVSR